MSSATAYPSAAWVTQTARNLVMDLQDAGCQVKYLSWDRNGKYPALLDAVVANGFSTVAAANTVTFGRTRAVVSAATATSLTFVVPIAAGSGRITVAMAGGSATSSTDFEGEVAGVDEMLRTIGASPGAIRPIRRCTART